MNNEQRAKELIQMVGRMFYDVKQVIILDYLMHARALTDDALAERLHCQLKEIHKLTAPLRDDRLVRVEGRAESALSDKGPGKAMLGRGSSSISPQSRVFTRTYIFMDYKMTIRAIKWRLEKMQEASTARLRADLEKRGYKCEQCGKQWGPLDVHFLPKGLDGFLCDNCGIVLAVDSSDPSEGSAKRTPLDLHEQLMDCIAPLIVLLKKINPDGLSETVSLNDILKASNAGIDGDMSKELPTPAKSSPEADVVVEFESENGAEKKDAMPIWHTHSTVTGARIVKDEERGIGSEEIAAKRARTEPATVEIVFDADSSATIAHVNEGDNDPWIKVRGTSKPFSQVSEEDKRMMTSEEYETFFEHYLRIQGQ